MLVRGGGAEAAPPILQSDERMEEQVQDTGDEQQSRRAFHELLDLVAKGRDRLHMVNFTNLRPNLLRHLGSPLCLIAGWG